MTAETTTKTTDTATNSNTSNATLKGRFEDFQVRAKAEWTATEQKARAELVSLPVRIKTGATEALAKLRDNLDLPRRAEVAALAARIEELAAKLAEYETQSKPAKNVKTAKADQA